MKKTAEEVLSHEHPSLLIGILNLAETYKDQHLWKEAEELEFQAVETIKGLLGLDHYYTIVGMASLAVT